MPFAEPAVEDTDLIFFFSRLRMARKALTPTLPTRLLWLTLPTRRRVPTLRAPSSRASLAHAPRSSVVPRRTVSPRRLRSWSLTSPTT